MRWRTSATVVRRYAPEGFDYQGVHIASGTFLTFLLPVAQRDPRAFPDGDRFDILAVRDTPPLHFGGGPHHCLGAALARAELAEALPALARRLEPPRVVAPIEWRPLMGIYGPNKLSLAFG